jgi:hypothetical protein
MAIVAMRPGAVQPSGGPDLPEMGATGRDRRNGRIPNELIWYIPTSAEGPGFGANMCRWCIVMFMLTVVGAVIFYWRV